MLVDERNIVCAWPWRLASTLRLLAILEWSVDVYGRPCGAGLMRMYLSWLRHMVLLVGLRYFFYSALKNIQRGINKVPGYRQRRSNPQS